MTPHPSKKALAHAQREAAAAFQQAQNLERSSLRKMQLINKAFPYAVHTFNNIDGGALSICWSDKYNAWAISDIGGFITLIDKDGIETVFLPALLRESVCKGSFREEITGKNPFGSPLKTETYTARQFNPAAYNLSQLRKMLASAKQIALNTAIPMQMKKKMLAIEEEISKKEAEAKAKAAAKKTKSGKIKLDLSLSDLELDINL